MKQEYLDESDIDDAIQQLSSLDLKSTSIDNLKPAIRSLLGTWIALGTIAPIGTSFYRARIMAGRPNRVRELSYPPRKFIKQLGRLNRRREPMFYSAVIRSAAVFEVKPEIGDCVAVSRWKSTSMLQFITIGHTSEYFNRARSNREDRGFHALGEQFRSDSGIGNVLAFLSSQFTRDVANDEIHLYKITIAIKEVLSELSPGPLPELIRQGGGLIANVLDSSLENSGLVYPSLAMSGNGDNVAIFPNAVDQHVKCDAVEWIEIVDKPEHLKLRAHILDKAIIEQSGTLSWTGKPGLGPI